MAIAKKDVEHVAKLARLTLSEKEAELYTGQLGKILAYVEQLGALDTKNIAPTTHTVSQSKALRNDEARPSLPQDEILSNSPEKAKGCFKVPRIIE